MQESICKSYCLQGLNLQNTQIAHTGRQERNNQPNWKIGRRSRDIPSKKKYRWPLSTWKDGQQC